MPQLRQNIVTGEWVVIAPERSKRPSDFIAAESIKEEAQANCPFCLTGPSYKTRLKSFENESVFVFPNKYPAFVEDATQASARAYRLEDGFYNARPSTGGHDVLVIKEHDKQLFDFTFTIWQDLFEIAKQRYQHWRQDKNAQYSMLIYNQGVKAGASIHHPHAQIMASNIIPNHISKELNGAQQYFEDIGSCVFCDLIKHEKVHRVRILEETDEMIAFTFYAARFPFEIWVLPKHHIAHYETETTAVVNALAHIMKKVTDRLAKVLHRPSLNFFLHDLPTSVDRADYFHWHVEITPRVSVEGGYELGSGVIIDVISPEEASRFLAQQRA